MPDICQDANQTLFKPCQGSEEVPCNKPVPVSLSEEPCCPLHLRLPPQLYVPEQVLSVPEELEAAPTDLYLSAAELQPTESLPLEFSDVSGSGWAACSRPKTNKQKKGSCGKTCPKSAAFSMCCEARLSCWSQKAAASPAPITESFFLFAGSEKNKNSPLKK